MTDTKNPVSDELPSLLEQWALDIDRDGTPSQAGPSVEELRQLAQSLRASIPGGVGVKGLAYKTTLAECPVGLFIAGSGELCLKTEYGSNEGRIDAYIVSSGEFFWGGTSLPAEQRKVLVTPALSALDLSPAEGEPDFWAVWSATGSHIGTWPDEADARAALAEYEGRIPRMSGLIKPLYAAPSNPVISDEMVESVAEALCRSSGTGWEFTQAKDHWREKARAALSVKPQSGSDKP